MDSGRKLAGREKHVKAAVKMAVERQSARLHSQTTQKVEGSYPTSRQARLFQNSEGARSEKRSEVLTRPLSTEVYPRYGAWWVLDDRVGLLKILWFQVRLGKTG